MTDFPNGDDIVVKFDEDTKGYMFELFVYPNSNQQPVLTNAVLKICSHEGMFFVKKNSSKSISMDLKCYTV